MSADRVLVPRLLSRSVSMWLSVAAAALSIPAVLVWAFLTQPVGNQVAGVVFCLVILAAPRRSRPAADLAGRRAGTAGARAPRCGAASCLLGRRVRRPGAQQPRGAGPPGGARFRAPYVDLHPRSSPSTWVVTAVSLPSSSVCWPTRSSAGRPSAWHLVKCAAGAGRAPGGRRVGAGLTPGPRPPRTRRRCSITGSRRTAELPSARRSQVAQVVGGVAHHRAVDHDLLGAGSDAPLAPPAAGTAPSASARRARAGGTACRRPCAPG